MHRIAATAFGTVALLTAITPSATASPAPAAGSTHALSQSFPAAGRITSTPAYGEGEFLPHDGQHCINDEIPIAWCTVMGAGEIAISKILGSFGNDPKEPLSRELSFSLQPMESPA
ncbi:hypothetical protein ACWC0C_38410 [Streptomyces sp. NPDC001709]